MLLATDKTFPILDTKACPRCEHKPCHAFARTFARHAMLVHPQEVPHTCPLRVPPFSDISRYRIDLMDVTKEEVIRVGMRGGTGLSKHAYDGNTPAFKLIEVLYRTKNIEILIAPYGSDAFKKITGWRENKISSARKREEEKQAAEKKEIEKEKPKPVFVEARWVWLEDPKRPGCDERELSTGVMKEALWCKVDTEGLMPGDRVTFTVYLKSRDGKEDIKITTEEGSVGKGRKDDAAVAKWLIPEQIHGYIFQPKLDQFYFIARCLAHQLEMRTSQNKFLVLTPKPSLIFRNPKWEIEKVGFEEETDISVELELSPEHAGNTKVTFELFAKTPKGPELVHQAEGHVDGGKARCRIPVYIPKYKAADGNSLQKVEYYFTAKHSESEPLDSSTTPKIIDEMAERLIESHILPDLNFAFDKSFLHPKHAAELKDMCAKIKAWREKNPQGKLAVFGHADAVGKEEYNKTLSERRAKSVFAFLMKDAEAWSELDKEEKWGLACIQDLLKYLGHDPGASDGQDGPKTQAAVKEFQRKKSLPVDGQAGAGTRKALYQAFIEDSNSLSLKAKDFDVIDGKSHTGCSEFNLVEKTEGASQPNRRVAVFLLKSNKNFPINYPCKQGDIGPCKIQKAKKGERRTPGFCCFFYDGLVKEEKKGGEEPAKLGPLKWIGISEQEIKQYVNLPAGKIDEGKERLIQVETSGAVEGTQVFWKVKAWEKNSKRTAPKLGVKLSDKVGSKEALIEFKSGLVELVSTFKDGKASIVIACGSAGGDTFIVEAGSTKDKMDVKVAVCNWRKLNYEIMAPDFMAIEERALPDGSKVKDFSSGMLTRIHERLGKAYVEYEVFKSHTFTDKDAPNGSVFKSEQLGLPAGGKGYILTDHTFKAYPKKFDKGMAPRSIGLKLCNKNYFFESFRTKNIAKKFEFNSKSLRVLVTDWYGKFFLPISAENGADAVKSLTWKAKIDPVKHPTHPGVNAGKQRTGNLSSSLIELITTSAFDINLPTTSPTDPGSFVGASVTETQCPIEVSIEFEGASEGLGLAGQGGQAGENLVVYNSDAPDSFVDVLLHELGHSMGQTVYSGTYLAPKGLAVPKQTDEVETIYSHNGTKGHIYVNKGHSGSHCAYGLGDGDKGSDSYSGKPGSCIMFGENSGSGASLAVTGYCPQCIDYIKARELDDLGAVLE